MLHRVVVVGASLAGLRAAETLRARGFDGELTLIGEEAHPPYDRPPLSKQVLQGTCEPDQTFFRRKEGTTRSRSTCGLACARRRSTFAPDASCLWMARSLTTIG